MSTAAWAAIWVTAGLAGSFLLAVLVGKVIRRGQDRDAQFVRSLPDPNRDNDRDDLGDHQ